MKQLNTQITVFDSFEDFDEPFNRALSPIEALKQELAGRLTVIEGEIDRLRKERSEIELAFEKRMAPINYAIDQREARLAAEQDKLSTLCRMEMLASMAEREAMAGKTPKALQKRI